jgi:hypothetical protein
MTEEEPEAAPDIIIEPAQMAGVWSNFAQVSHSEYEFTLDFIRIDYNAPPPGTGIVVSRVSLSPLLVTQLMDALQENWNRYAERALPPEVHGGTTD